jgi:hypothetical protein
MLGGVCDFGAPVGALRCGNQIKCRGESVSFIKTKPREGRCVYRRENEAWLEREKSQRKKKKAKRSQKKKKKKKVQKKENI